MKIAVVANTESHQTSYWRYFLGQWVDKEMIAEFRRVRNKEHVLFRMAEAAVDHPDEVVRQAWWCSGSPSLCSPRWR